MADESTVLEAYRRGLISPELAKAKILEIRQGAPLSMGEKALGLVGEAGQGAGFNLVDEAAAGVATPVVAALQGRSDFGNIYKENKGIANDLFSRTEKQMPIASTAANIAGGLNTGAKFLGRAKNAGQLAKRSAVMGAAYGAGEGDSISERAGNAAGSAAIAAPVGFAGGVLANKLLPNDKTTPDDLKNAYRGVKESLKGIKLAPQDVEAGLASKVRDNVGQSIFNVTDKSVPAAIGDLNRFGKRGATAYQLDEFRSQLGSDPLSSRIRGNIDEFMQGSGIPTEYRDLYRRAKVAENLDSAINKGSESALSLKNRIRTLSENTKGLTSEEKDALRRAGRTGLAENAIRVGKLPAAILSLGTGSGLNATAGAGVYLGGKALDNVADRIAKQRAQDALELILMGGKKGLTYSQRFGKLTGIGK